MLKMLINMFYKLNLNESINLRLSLIRHSKIGIPRYNNNHLEMTNALQFVCDEVSTQRIAQEM